MQERFGEIQQKMRGDYAANRSEWMNLWNAQSIDTRLEAGDSSLSSELNAVLPNNFTAQWYFNMVRPRLNMAAGHQSNTRKSSIVVPAENGDQETADQWTKIIMQLYKKEGIYKTISTAFHQGACVSGLNLIQVYLDFTHDPLNGDIKADRVPYSAVIMDPYWRKLDLSDCSFVQRRHYVRYEEACALLPDQTDFIMNLPSGSAGTRKNDKFTFMPQNFGLSTTRLLSYDEYYYRTYRDQTMLYDKDTGETMEVSIEDPDYLRHFMQTNPQVALIEQKIPTVRLAIAVQDEVLWEGPQNTGLDRMPFSPVVGFFSPELISTANRFQGMARSLRDVQMLFNRRLILNSDLAESLVTSGVFYKEGSVLDESHLYQTGAGRNVPVDRNCNIATDIVPRQAATVPQEYFRIQEDYLNLFGPVSGINDANMGDATDAIPGITTRLKMGAGLTTLQPLFDSLDTSQVNLTEIIMDVVRASYTPGKIKSMLGGEEPAPLFYNKAFGKYHCMVESGYDTESQKQLQFAQMYQLMQIKPDLFDNEDILEAATVQNKTRMIEKSQQRQQAAQQMQQQQLQAQQELQQAQIADMHGRAQANTSLGNERDSRVPENRAFAVQRLSEAEEQRELAVLNKVKALKELEDLDINQIRGLIEMANLLKTQNKVEEQILKQETEPTNQPL
jgi:hypothetical protein